MTIKTGEKNEKDKRRILLNWRNDKILKETYHYIKEKNILDVGCVEHSINNINRDRIWVHDFLRRYSKEITGIDILKKDINILKKQGYNVYCQSAENFKFNKRFEVIFAGELIEHLNNPGLFLDNCQKHLEINGILILTTPNAFSIKRIVESIIKYTNDPTVNNEHTAWFSPKVLIELCRRYNFQLVKLKYFDFPSLDKKVLKKLVKIISSVIGLKFKETMFVVLRKN